MGARAGTTGGFVPALIATALSTALTMAWVARRLPSMAAQAVADYVEGRHA